ncbi:MAG: SURF1 family protein [Burkholderiales bacterium]|nr:MAG: SURF1 family protein [Burkholderiales bacterium]
MSGIRLRLLPTLAAAAMIALAVSLGQWQLRRADEKRAIEAEREWAERAAPFVLGAGAGPARGGGPRLDAVDAAALVGRRVRATGSLVTAASVFVDNRTHAGRAGFHVLTPLALADGGGHVLVLRGWIGADPRERTRLPQLASPSAPVTIEGLAQSDLEQSLQLDRLFRSGPDDEPPAPGQRVWQNASIARYAAWSGLELLPIVIRQSSPLDDGLVRDWPRAGGDVDKHLGYAFQWFALAALTAGMWLYFSWRRGGEA